VNAWVSSSKNKLGIIWLVFVLAQIIEGGIMYNFLYQSYFHELAHDDH
jgi:hypothetical protein